MARTPIFRMMTRTLAAAQAAAEGFERGSISRRGLLRGSAAAAAASLAGAWSARAEEERERELRVAIVGGGAAGLTAAYRLQSQGLRPVVFEAADRWGGRMLTVPDFYRGMFAELGGELVDTRHEDLKTLAEELSLSLEAFSGDPAERDRDLYFFGGKLRAPGDMLNAGAGAFVPVAQQLAIDKKALRDEADAFTARARALDATSLAGYLKQFRGKTEDWAIDLIAVAYTIECGVDPAEQSSLNLVDLISTDPKEHFEIFGESDEAFRIEGGSSRLIDALVAACRETCDLRLGAELTAIARRDSGIELTCAANGGTKAQVFDAVILALPFTKLRAARGIDALGLSPLKLKAIRELGYGNNMKLVCGTASRAWRTPGAGLPHPSNGCFYSDLPFQNVWDSSRAQPGDHGLLSNFMAGKALPATRDDALANLQSGLSAISPAIGASLDRDAAASFSWGQHPMSLGSYACARPGQYTTLLSAARTEECDGRLHFAGEHTEPEFLGYMNGAVMSGNRAAMEILMEAVP
ncbi:MAG: NAD(P)/FAD-dependent oxidoreductase [Rhodomicrobium sp.]